MTSRRLFSRGAAESAVRTREELCDIQHGPDRNRPINVREKGDPSLEILVTNLGTQPRRVYVQQDQILTSAEALIRYRDVLVGRRAVDEALCRKGIGFVNARPQS